MFEIGGGNTMNASQIGHAIEEHNQQRQVGSKSPGADTLLFQYKQCSALNDQALREAKTIKELVDINVATVDNRKLFMNSRCQSRNGKYVSEANYDLQFDGLNYIQKMPLMGDPDFLVNQSILQTSTNNNRIAEAVNRQKFMLQTRSGTPNNLTPKCNYFSAAHPNESTARMRHSNNSGLRSLLPELPLSGFQVRRPRKKLFSNQTMRERSTKVGQSVMVQSSTDETQDKTMVSPTVKNETMDFESPFQIDGRGSQIDPVRCLQNIFRQNKRRERRPGVSLIAEKYKKEAHESSKSRQGSRMVGTANTFNTTGQFYQNSDLNGSSTSKIAMPFSSNPAHGANIFSQKIDSNNGYQSKPGTGAILVQRDETRSVPPATAPNCISRPQVIGDLKAAVSENGRLLAGQQLHQTKNRHCPTNSRNNNDTEVSERVDNSELQLGSQNNSQYKRGIKPNMVDQITQIQKPSNYASSQLAFSEQCLQPRSSTRGSTMNGLTNNPISELLSPNVSLELKGTRRSIRQKLAQMKQLFEDEDDAKKTDLQNRVKASNMARPESSEWDLHKHKLAYEEVLQKRQKFVEQEEQRKSIEQFNADIPQSFDDKEDNKAEKPKKKHEYRRKTKVDMQEDELKDFLICRIAELRDVDKSKLEDLNSEKFKFRASTISNVLPQDKVIEEQSRLEANYKNRFKNQGTKLHNRMLNDQLRQIRHTESQQNKSHQQVLDELRKEVVSNRSRDTSPSPSPQSRTRSQSPKVLFENPLTESDTASRQLQSRNTELGYLNHFNSSNTTKAPMTPQGLTNKKTADAQVIAINECFSEKLLDSSASAGQGGVIVGPKAKKGQTFHQATDKDDYDLSCVQQLPESLKKIQTKAISNPSSVDQFLNPLALEQESETPNTAIIVIVDEQSLQKGKKINYFSQVLRRIELIDRSFAKEQKRRKMGLGKDALEIVNNAVESLKINSRDESEVQSPLIDDSKNFDDVLSDEDELIRQIDSGNTLKSDQAYSNAPQSNYQMKKASEELSVAEEVNINSLRISSKNKTTHEPIILEVKGESYEPDAAHLYYNQQSCLNSQLPISNTIESAVRATTSRAFSRGSDQSRIHTVENIDPEQLNHQNMSERAPSVDRVQNPSPHKVVVMQHTNQSFDVTGDLVFPNTVSRQTSKSFRGDQSKEGLPAMKTIQNIKFDGEGIGNDTQNTNKTFSVKLSAKGSNLQHVSVNNTGRLSDVNVPQIVNICHGQQESSQHNQEEETTIDDVQPTPTQLNISHAMVTGSQLAYFCPKRFNRFPRFTIFFKKNTQNDHSTYDRENTVSLSADFLKFLSDQRVQAQSTPPPSTMTHTKNQTDSMEDSKGITPIIDKTRRATCVSHDALVNPAGSGNDLNTVKNFDSNEGKKTPRNKRTGKVLNNEDLKQDQDSPQQETSGCKVPLEVEKWQQYLKEKDFDPFERVVLVKGIDNSILTSFRTLKGQNNTVSDTFKVVHKKFQPLRSQNTFFKNMVCNHVDKLLYQTTVKPIEEEEGEEDLEIKHTLDYDEYSQSQQKQLEDSQKSQPMTHAKRLIFDPQKDNSQNNPGSGVIDPLNETKLHNSMTAVLFDLDNQRGGISTPGNIRQNPSIQIREVEKNPQSKAGTSHTDVISKDASSYQTHYNKRLARPKPLNIGANSSARRQNSNMSSPKGVETGMGTIKTVKRNKIPTDVTIQQPSLGVTGVSPLTAQQIVGSKYSDQNKKLTKTDSGKIPTDFNQIADKNTDDRHKAGIKYPKHQQKIQVPTTTNSQHNSTQIGIAMNSAQALEKDNKDINLTNNQNFQYNSTVTVERKEDPLNKRNSGDVIEKKRNKEQLFTEAFMSPEKTQHASGIMGISKRENVNLENNNQPKSTLSMEYQKFVSPDYNSLSNRQQMVVDPFIGRVPAKITAQDKQKQPNKHKLSNPDNGNNESLSLKNEEQDSMIDFTGRVNLSNKRISTEFAPGTRVMSPPLVSIIRSNTQISDNNQGFSAMAKDESGVPSGGDSPTLRTTAGPQKPIYIDSDQLVKEMQLFDQAGTSSPPGGALIARAFNILGDQKVMEVVTDSPIIHKALQGRKLNRASVQAKQKGSDIQNSFNWTTLTGSTGGGAAPNLDLMHINSSSIKKQKAMKGMQATKPSDHVGVLAVPDSLKARHTSPIFGVEYVASDNSANSKTNKKGAIGGLIDKIYDKDRKMINNSLKGNMMSTVVLNEIYRYHKLKSQTGVEGKYYDKSWLQERIQEELSTPGLILEQISPSNLQSSMQSNNLTTKAEHSSAKKPRIQAERIEPKKKPTKNQQILESPERKKSNRSTSQILFENPHGITTETKESGFNAHRLSSEGVVRKSLQGILGDFNSAMKPKNSLDYDALNNMK